MMNLDTIHSSWFLWFSGIVLFMMLLRFLGKNRRAEVQPGMATKSDQFSMRTVFLNFKSGEAGLFFTVMLILVSCFLFSIAVARQVAKLVGL